MPPSCLNHRRDDDYDAPNRQLSQHKKRYLSERAAQVVIKNQGTRCSRNRARPFLSGANARFRLILYAGNKERLVSLLIGVDAALAERCADPLAQAFGDAIRPNWLIQANSGRQVSRDRIDDRSSARAVAATMIWDTRAGSRPQTRAFIIGSTGDVSVVLRLTIALMCAYRRAGVTADA